MRSFFSISLRRIPFFCMLVLSTLAVISCDEENDDGMMMPEAPEVTGESKMFSLGSVSDPNISGTATFTELEGGATQIVLSLNGTPVDGMHPAHIHMNSAAEGGDIAISLMAVDGSTGMSETTVESTDDGATITYDDLLEFDGYINVHLSAGDLGTLVAQGDIGANELTGESKTYTLMEKDVDGIMGAVRFEQRVSGFTLATIVLENTPDGGMHPAHIHMNSAAEGGDIAVTFNTVDGNTGMSKTDISLTDSGDEITYAQLLNYDGYVNVHLSAEELGTLVAQGDIGANELTGESTTFALMEKDVMGINGTVTFAQRKNGLTLATIMLEGTPESSMHPAHIHDNTAETGGPIAITFNPINGSTGMSMTTIRMKDGETSEMISYEDIITYNGYVNVHLSAQDLGTLVAQGNIGDNGMPVE